MRCILTGAEYSRVIFLRDDQLDLAFDKAATAARYAGYRHDKSHLRAIECRHATPAEIAALRDRLRWII